MMTLDLPRLNGSTSNIFRVFIGQSTVTTGAGLTGLTNTSTGLSISVMGSDESSGTNYTVASSNVEAVTTLGTYAAPSANKCRFQQVDATNQPGMYELHIADARFNRPNASYIDIIIKGATNARPVTLRVPLGVAGLPKDKASGVSGGVLVVGTNTGTVTITDGLVINRSTANRSAIELTGDGTGAGLLSVGGSTGNGGQFLSGTGATGGGIVFQAQSTNGTGLTIIGNGNGHGMFFQGGASNGIGFYSLGQGSGYGALFRGGNAAGSHGFVIESGSGSTGVGLKIQNNSTNGDGVQITAAGTGNGVTVGSGSGATGTGILVLANSTNGSGISFVGAGTGNGIQTSGGASNGNGLYSFGQGTGHGAYFSSGAGASGDGIRSIASSTNGNGMFLLKTGSGKDLNATSTSLLVTANVTELVGSSAAASALKSLHTGMEVGTCQSGSTSTTIKLATAASSADDYYKDSAVVVSTGTGAKQVRKILSYVGTTRVATVDVAWVSTPDNTSEYLILGRIV